jgi:hypothetical protein
MKDLTAVKIYEDDDGNVQVGISNEFVEAKQRMTTEAFQFYMMTADLDFDVIIESHSAYHTLTPIFDPTAYMRSGNTMDDLVALARSMKKLRDHIEPMFAKAIEEVNGGPSDATE